MPFDLADFQRRRPFLYHLTARENLDSIRRRGALECAARFFDAAGRPDLKRKRRQEGLRLQVDEKAAHIRDQRPLHPGNMRLDPPNMSFEDFVALLNKYVFFWPGGKDGPNDYGQRHFKRYLDEKPALIRVRTNFLLAANSGNSLLFCRYNSGAPRWSNGKPSLRGRSTFLKAASAPFTAGKVIEAVYAGCAKLPEDAEWGDSPDGPWRPLFP